MKPGPLSYQDRYRSFEQWFQTNLGRALIADQRKCVERVLADVLPGARQLQVGISHRLPLASTSDFTHKVISTPEWCPDLPPGVVVCDGDELPFPSESMDLVILHHTADFSAYPHQVVREASRILRGGGQMLTIGFNPLSLWGMRKWLSRSTSGPWGGRFLFRSRLEDWLNLLDFELDRSGTYFMRFPVQNQKLLEQFERLERLGGHRFLPIGGYYCILATKRIGAMIKTRPLWRRDNVVTLPGSGAIGASRGYIRISGNSDGK
ncbi:MAG: class I SAM-dependent methyltransferase [Marinobacter sp.]|uniref:class I SAM-dependent methyltransferase n=1 Tax=Marinobacter sp. TaxID=50741 RepID=UPI00299E7234|nr:class I SAM-dependent methyltransferase [Marinobacter sp.]MDX1754979.1 class I SAM-dependent methyltransferase [Marinobacter sp.]